jgi:hypothetical protein
MASVTFDELWDDVFAREGDLVAIAKALAHAYKISSAIESIRLAKVFLETGQSFYECCDAIYKARKQNIRGRVKWKYKLTEHDLEMIRKMIEKKNKGS